MLAGTTATPTGTLSYDPFGAQNGTDSQSVGTDAQASLLGYQSQPTDPTTGLVDMGTRLYDPTEGRFTTQDTQFGTPTDPATLNQYIYAQDSPLVYTDPNGERPTCNGCSRSETQEVTDEWAAGYAASQGDAATAAQYRKLATYYANHPSPPPPPAAARPIVALLSALPSGWVLRHGATIARGSGQYCHPVPRGVPSCFNQPSVPDQSWEQNVGLGGVFAVVFLLPVAADAVVTAGAGAAADSAGSDAFAEAAGGGRNAGFLRNYLGRPAGQLQRGINSLQDQIDAHLAKIANPADAVDDWEGMGSQEQDGLLSKWQGDVARQQAQQSILQDLLNGRLP